MVVKEREFVEAGRSLGYSDIRLMLGHILPNILPEILVMGSLWLATAIRVEASLAFIGLGVSPPTATWGGMIREGFENILDSFWLALFPSLAILVVVFALNLLGEGLRDAIDPTLRGASCAPPPPPPCPAPPRPSASPTSPPRPPSPPPGRRGSKP